MLGTWPMVSDLRTGAATTGSAEQGLVSSASCQMARFYGIPNGSISGISDSKLPDAQSGFEKGAQHSLVGNSGGNVLFCAAGALAAGLGCSHAGVVIDNEIIGTALRTVAGFEVNEETMGVDMIREVCLSGPGHYLGHEATLRRMKDGFYYPPLSDRSGMNDWLESGSPFHSRPCRRSGTTDTGQSLPGACPRRGRCGGSCPLRHSPPAGALRWRGGGRTRRRSRRALTARMRGNDMRSHGSWRWSRCRPGSPW